MMKLKAIVLDSDNFPELAAFYARLLGGEVTQCNEHYAQVRWPGSPLCYFFQNAEGYVPPVWPEGAEKQQQMVHMDYEVADVEQAVQHALACGATMAPVSFMQRDKVMFDPAGHPFCICRRE